MKKLTILKASVAVLILVIATMPLAFADGNVQVSVTETGSLNISGDLSNNKILIKQVGPGSYKVKGINKTTIEGKARQVFNGVVNSVSITMIGGNNVVQVKNASITNDLRFRFSDSPKNVIKISNISIENDLDFRFSNSSKNVIKISNTSIEDDMRIRSDRESSVLFR